MTIHMLKLKFKHLQLEILAFFEQLRESLSEQPRRQAIPLPIEDRPPRRYK